MIRNIEIPGSGGETASSHDGARDADVNIQGIPPPIDGLTQAVLDMVRDDGHIGGSVIETTENPIPLAK